MKYECFSSFLLIKLFTALCPWGDTTKLHCFFHFALFITYHFERSLLLFKQKTKIFFCRIDVFTLSYYSHCSSNPSWHDYAPVERINLHTFFRFHFNHNNHGCWRRRWLPFILPELLNGSKPRKIQLDGTSTGTRTELYFQSDFLAANWVTEFTQRR